MATNRNDAVSAVDNPDEEATKFDDANVSHDVELKINANFLKKNMKTTIDNCDEEFENVFACNKSLLEATKFDEANFSHDVKLKINPSKFWLKTYSCSSCESGLSCTGSTKELMPTLKQKRQKGKQFG